MPTFAGVQTFAGAFDLGAVEAGLTMKAKLENQAGFGIENCTANRGQLAGDWEPHAGDPVMWPVHQVDVVLSNPPCSGFSVMTASKSRGIDAKINKCMWDTFRYATRVRPSVIVMESVQQAVSQGMPLMRALRDELEDETGMRYHMTHVLQSNHALGGCSLRRRYFMVLTDGDPIKMKQPVLDHVATLHDAIGDLEVLPLSWESQEYPAGHEPSKWLKECQAVSPDGRVDGHHYRENDHTERNIDLLTAFPVGQGENVNHALRTAFESGGSLPESWQDVKRSGETHEQTVRRMLLDEGREIHSFHATPRLRYGRQAPVISGKGTFQCFHPVLNRHITNREVARIMGFPDDWVIAPNAHHKLLTPWWGKGVSVEAGRWVSQQVVNWLEDRDEGDEGVPASRHPRLKQFGDVERERVIDVSRPLLTE